MPSQGDPGDDSGEDSGTSTPNTPSVALAVTDTEPAAPKVLTLEDFIRAGKGEEAGEEAIPELPYDDNRDVMPNPTKEYFLKDRPVTPLPKLKEMEEAAQREMTRGYYAVDPQTGMLVFSDTEEPSFRPMTGRPDDLIGSLLSRPQRGDGGSRHYNDKTYDALLASKKQQFTTAERFILLRGKSSLDDEDAESTDTSAVTVHPSWTILVGLHGGLGDLVWFFAGRSWDAAYRSGDVRVRSRPSKDGVLRMISRRAEGLIGDIMRFYRTCSQGTPTGNEKFIPIEGRSYVMTENGLSEREGGTLFGGFDGRAVADTVSGLDNVTAKVDTGRVSRMTYGMLRKGKTAEPPAQEGMSLVINSKSYPPLIACLLGSDDAERVVRLISQGWAEIDGSIVDNVVVSIDEEGRMLTHSGNRTGPPPFTVRPGLFDTRSVQMERAAKYIYGAIFVLASLGRSTSGCKHSAHACALLTQRFLVIRRTDMLREVSRVGWFFDIVCVLEAFVKLRLVPHLPVWSTRFTTAMRSGEYLSVNGMPLQLEEMNDETMLMALSSSARLAGLKRIIVTPELAEMHSLKEKGVDIGFFPRDPGLHEAVSNRILNLHDKRGVVDDD